MRRGGPEGGVGGEGGVPRPVSLENGVFTRITGISGDGPGVREGGVWRLAGLPHPRPAGEECPAPPRV